MACTPISCLGTPTAGRLGSRTPQSQGRRPIHLPPLPRSGPSAKGWTPEQPPSASPVLRVQSSVTPALKEPPRKGRHCRRLRREVTGATLRLRETRAPRKGSARWGSPHLPARGTRALTVQVLAVTEAWTRTSALTSCVTSDKAPAFALAPASPVLKEKPRLASVPPGPDPGGQAWHTAMLSGWHRVWAHAVSCSSLLGGC